MDSFCTGVKVGSRFYTLVVECTVCKASSQLDLYVDLQIRQVMKSRDEGEPYQLKWLKNRKESQCCTYTIIVKIADVDTELEA